jgi:hypothetical protein
MKSLKSFFEHSSGLYLSLSSKLVSFFNHLNSLIHSFLSNPSTFYDVFEGFRGGLADFSIAFYPNANFSLLPATGLGARFRNFSLNLPVIGC